MIIYVSNIASIRQTSNTYLYNRGDVPMADSKILEDLGKSIECCDADMARHAVGLAVEAGMSPSEIMNGLRDGMERLCAEFDAGTVFLPQIVLASRAMDAALAEMSGLFGSSDELYLGTVVMGTVRGDIHEIGKNLCVAMLRAAGYKVVDIGADNGPEEFIAAAKANGAEIISASSLMTTTLRAQKSLVDMNASCGKLFRCILGGAPCTREWCESIGADGYSASADGIVELVSELMPDVPLAMGKSKKRRLLRTGRIYNVPDAVF